MLFSCDCFIFYFWVNYLFNANSSALGMLFVLGFTTCTTLVISHIKINIQCHKFLVSYTIRLNRCMALLYNLASWLYVRIISLQLLFRELKRNIVVDGVVGNSLTVSPVRPNTAEARLVVIGWFSCWSGAMGRIACEISLWTNQRPRLPMKQGWMCSVTGGRAGGWGGCWRWCGWQHPLCCKRD